MKARNRVVPCIGIEEYATSIDQILDYWIKFNGINVPPQLNTFNNDTTKLKPSICSKENNFKYDNKKNRTLFVQVIEMEFQYNIIKPSMGITVLK